ncbi:putative ATP-dependent RNA helicase DDX52 [Hypsibius exemplaris]|uniref:Probable ATP-dependent RNA helicase DDX52 n=1 Tax=Hypsibius exemplaris TaxID=2072580 RepID=A0A1W0X055_HYPEX|nr:putative ATP-dependent RNA helicase DDX52 [Hypsibius exemplaris]
MDVFKALTFGTKLRSAAANPLNSKRTHPAISPLRSKAISGKSGKTLDDLFSRLVGTKKSQNDPEMCVEPEDEDAMAEDESATDSQPDSDYEDAPFFDIINDDPTKNAREDDSDADGDNIEDGQGNIQLYSGTELSGAAFQPKPKSKKKNKRRNEAQRRAQIQQEEINRFRNEKSIHVEGTDVCQPVSAFEDLIARYDLDSRLAANIESVGYKAPTPIQMQAIPLLLEKREILASAPTGSGKTAAFLIPVIQTLAQPKDVGYRAVIVSPTRELAKQTFFEFERLSAGIGLRAHLLEDVPKVIKKFKAKPSLALQFDVLITTPNRLVFLLKDKTSIASLKQAEWLIIDESDKLFEAHIKGGFRDQLAVIYKACSHPGIRRALFSATFATEVEDWCKANLDNVVGISIGARNSATATIHQKLIFVGNETGKLTALRQIFRKDYTPPVLIFVQTKQKAKELHRQLKGDGVHADVIHSDRDQAERDAVVSDFRSGKVWTLIATEVLGRGIDFKGVNLVVNYDFPLSSISYIHRIGRTGRAGNKGKAVTLFTEKDAPNLRSIASVMRRSGCEVPEFMLQLKPSSGSGLKRLKRDVLDRKATRAANKSKLPVAAAPAKLQGLFKKKRLVDHKNKFRTFKRK